MEIKKAAICGMGALGAMYGSIISKAGGDVVFVMDDERFARERSRARYINGVRCELPTVRAAEAERADLLIVAVKSPGLPSALDTVERCVGEGTVIMSVLNGITSEKTIAARFGAEHMIYAVAQGTDAVMLDGELRFSKVGELRVGAFDGGMSENLDRVCEYLGRVSIPCVREEDIMRRMWGKFMFNVGLNQSCMIFGTNYGGCADPSGVPYMLMVSAMREVIAVARCEGIDIGEETLREYVGVLSGLTPEAMPSMRQDRIMRRPSEVEMFAGTVIKLAEKHMLTVPVNDYFYRRIKEIEAEY